MEKEIVDRLIFKSGMTAKDYKFEQEIPKRPNPLKLAFKRNRRGRKTN